MLTATLLNFPLQGSSLPPPYPSHSPLMHWGCRCIQRNFAPPVARPPISPVFSIFPYAFPFSAHNNPFPSPLTIQPVAPLSIGLTTMYVRFLLPWSRPPRRGSVFFHYGLAKSPLRAHCHISLMLTATLPLAPPGRTPSDLFSFLLTSVRFPLFRPQ